MLLREGGEGGRSFGDVCSDEGGDGEEEGGEGGRGEGVRDVVDGIFCLGEI